MPWLPRAGFPKGGRFLSVGGRKFAGGVFKFFRDELTLDIVEFQVMSKKKGLSCILSNFKTYTRYFGTADEKQK